MRTIKEYLSELPDELRQEILEEMLLNLERFKGSRPANPEATIEDQYLSVVVQKKYALYMCFVFSDTKKGVEYWLGIHYKYFYND